VESAEFKSLVLLEAVREPWLELVLRHACVKRHIVSPLQVKQLSRNYLH
jgi:hypothetical protein